MTERALSCIFFSQAWMLALAAAWISISSGKSAIKALKHLIALSYCSAYISLIPVSSAVTAPLIGRTAGFCATMGLTLFTGEESLAGFGDFRACTEADLALGLA